MFGTALLTRIAPPSRIINCPVFKVTLPAFPIPLVAVEIRLGTPLVEVPIISIASEALTVTLPPLPVAGKYWLVPGNSIPADSVNILAPFSIRKVLVLMITSPPSPLSGVAVTNPLDKA